MGNDDQVQTELLAEMRALESFREDYVLRHPQSLLTRDDPDVHRLMEALAFFSLRTRRAGLLDDGHIEAAPHGARQIDQGIAEAATCPHCLGRMSYAPLWNRAAKSYYAFAVCGPCDVAVEF